MNYYGYETWHLMLREEQRLAIFENKTLTQNLSQKGRGKHHNDELHNL